MKSILSYLFILTSTRSSYSITCTTYNFFDITKYHLFLCQSAEPELLIFTIKILQSPTISQECNVQIMNNITTAVLDANNPEMEK